MEVSEPERIPSRRGRKPTGKKTMTVGMGLPKWLYDRLQQDAKAKEDSKEHEICTVQNIIRNILFKYYENMDQPTLFEKTGN